MNLRIDPARAPDFELPSWLRSPACPATREAACVAEAGTTTVLEAAPVLFAGGDARAALVTAVDARLGTMREMAAAKWTSCTRIEDPPREAEVLEAVTTQALALGLDAVRVQHWFLAQMAAAREVQRHWHAAWGRNGMCGECRRPPDLAVLRRFIDASNTAQLRALSLVAPQRLGTTSAEDERLRDDVAACLCWIGRRYGVAEATTGRLVAAWRAVHCVDERGGCVVCAPAIAVE